MNPLTLVKRTQQINAKEAALGISEDASWHARYKESAYVFVGGVPFELTEGDVVAVFAQYGEVVDVNLVRDKGTGKSKGFAFVAYEDQRSTNLAVDNLNGALISGRTIRVDHVEKYKKKEEEDEEAEQKKREERGVCRAFQKGECTRGAGCKFSHDEQRAANTGWGEKADMPSKRNERQSGFPVRVSEPAHQERDATSNRDSRSSRPHSDRHYDRGELGSRDERLENRHRNRSDRDDGLKDRGRKSYENEPNSRGERDRRDEKRSRKDEPESFQRRDRDSSRGKDRSAPDSSDGRRSSEEARRSRSQK